MRKRIIIASFCILSVIMAATGCGDNATGDETNMSSTGIINGIGNNIKEDISDGIENISSGIEELNDGSTEKLTHGSETEKNTEKGTETTKHSVD